MVDCVLVYPNPSQDSPNRNLALGILFVGAALEQRGFSVAYIDLRFDTMDDIVRLLTDGARVLGVSVMTGNQCIQAADILHVAKAIAPNISTVLGGVHPSMLPLACLNEPEVDFVVVGEGEETTVELVSAIKDGTRDFSGIAGLGWKDHGEPKLNPERPFMDLARVPLPLTPASRRFYAIAARTSHVSYFTTRGCPFRCTFCYNLVFNRRKWRSLPMERLKEDLNRIRREVAFDHVYFVDDYVGHRVDRLAALADTMRSVGMTWHSSIRVNDIKPETAKILSDGLCNLLLLGVESAAEEVQQGILVKDYRRGADDVRTCVNSIVKTKITPLYSFMYNVPGETREMLEQSFQLAEWIYRTDQRARIGFYAYTPYPGTPLYQDALQSGFQPPSRLRDWGEMSLSNELNPRLRDLYYIAGLRFRGRKGDRTNENFPHLRRLLILPFEILSWLRWRQRRFVYSNFERGMVTSLIQSASRRAR
jgi:anaerobic magnesium-protoporphyrin IX monomethyl ester cyclase